METECLFWHCMHTLEHTFGRLQEKDIKIIASGPNLVVMRVQTIWDQFHVGISEKHYGISLSLPVYELANV